MLIGRYCAMTAPGPVESTLGALGVKVILHTDSELVYSGFKARYIFENAKSIFGGTDHTQMHHTKWRTLTINRWWRFLCLLDCGSNISSLHYGIITSPNFPNKYDAPSRNLASKTCNWFISVRPNHQILLNFELFSVEGEQSGTLYIHDQFWSGETFIDERIEHRKCCLLCKFGDVQRPCCECGSHPRVYRWSCAGWRIPKTSGAIYPTITTCDWGSIHDSMIIGIVFFFYNLF